MATDISNPLEFAESTQRALAEFILAVADTKRLLGIRYAEWCDGAPALEASVAASAMAQDELGHSRALLPLLTAFPQIDPAIPEEGPRREFSAVTYLDQPFATWPTFVAANLLIGHALTIALQSARTSRYVPLRTRAVKILEEERFHWLHGKSWFERLATHDKEGADLALRVEEILPQSLCWFGRGEDNRLTTEGVLDAGPEALRTQFLNQVGPLIVKSKAEYLMRIEGGRWQYTGGMPWARFDPSTRRLKKIERG